MNPIGTAWRRASLSFGACALVALAGTGCAFHLSEEPAGDSAVSAKAFWEGTWMPEASGKDDGFTRTVTLTVRDVERGILDASWIELTEGKPKIRTERIFIRRAGPWLLASAPLSAFFRPESAPFGKTLYAWARLEVLAGDLVVVSAPDANAFAGYLDEPARSATKKDRVVVARVGMDLLGRLQPEDNAWMRPIVFRKLKQPEDYPFPED